MTTTVEQYIAFWNAGTSDGQRELAAAAFADQITYYVPIGVLHGSEELIGFRNQFAEHSAATRSGRAPKPRHTTAARGCSGS